MREHSATRSSKVFVRQCEGPAVPSHSHAVSLLPDPKETCSKCVGGRNPRCGGAKSDQLTGVGREKVPSPLNGDAGSVFGKRPNFKDIGILGAI